MRPSWPNGSTVLMWRAHLCAGTWRPPGRSTPPWSAPPESGRGSGCPAMGEAGIHACVSMWGMQLGVQAAGMCKAGTCRVAHRKQPSGSMCHGMRAVPHSMQSAARRACLMKISRRRDWPNGLYFRLNLSNLNRQNERQRYGTEEGCEAKGGKWQRKKAEEKRGRAGAQSDSTAAGPTWVHYCCRQLAATTSRQLQLPETTGQHVPLPCAGRTSIQRAVRSHRWKMFLSACTSSVSTLRW